MVKEKRHVRSLKATGPLCPGCGEHAVLTSGLEIYPDRPDLAKKPIWLCRPCNSYCGCHPGTKKPLGSPASIETRLARELLHKHRLDPLWKNAVSDLGYEPEDQKARAIIRNVARHRVYSYLAEKLGITRDECHVGMFTIEQCRDAWRILSETDYAEIRAWAKTKSA